MISRFVNVLSEPIALSAIEHIAKYLPRAVKDGNDIEAREAVAYGSTIAGLTMQLTSTTAEHSMEHAMSAYHYDLPHGAGLIMISNEFYRFFVERHACDGQFIKMAPPDSPGVPPVPMPDIPPLSPEGFPESSISADIICKRLEHLSKKRLFSVRKNGNRAEWKVRPANFVDAYLFLLSIPRVEVSRLTTRRIGDKTVISVSFQDGGKIELINKKILSEKKLFLRLTKGKECLLTIYFINS